MSKSELLKIVRALRVLALFSVFLPYEGSATSYSLIQGDFTWHEAKADAETRAGHLATITSEEEWNTIFTALGSSLENKNIWLGASDEETEGVWKWVTGEAWDFTRWSLGTGNGGVDQPDNGNPISDQNHLILGQSYNLDWDDVHHDHDVPYYLLEVESEAIPESGATLGFFIISFGALGMFRLRLRTVEAERMSTTDTFEKSLEPLIMQHDSHGPTAPRAREVPYIRHPGQLLVALPYSANPGFTPTRITAFGFTIETSVPWLNPDEGSQADVHPDDISAHHSLLHDALLAPGRRPVRHFHHAAGPAKTTSDRPAVVR